MIGSRRDKTTEVAVTVSTESFLKLAALSILTLVLIMAVKQASHALLLVFISFFLALALNAPVSWVARHLPGRVRGSRSLATSLSFLVVVLVIGGFLASMVPPLVKQTQTLVHAAPKLVQDLRSQDSTTGKLIRKYNLQGQVNNVSKQLSSRLKNVGGAAFSTVEKIGSSVFALLTILALTFMMLVEGPRWLAFMEDVIPDRHNKLADRLLHDMYRVIKGYVNGQVTLAVIAAGFITPALFFLHVSYAIALVAVIFICGLIPMVGHTLGAIIVTFVALFHSTSSAIIILLYYILYQQIENYLIQPRIQANSTNMSPLLVFMSVVIGISFGGLFGGLVAIPAAGCLRIVVLEYLRSKKIIDTPEFNAQTASS